jgi:hypothetical protein
MECFEKKICWILNIPGISEKQGRGPVFSVFGPNGPDTNWFLGDLRLFSTNFDVLYRMVPLSSESVFFFFQAYIYNSTC